MDREFDQNVLVASFSLKLHFFLFSNALVSVRLGGWVQLHVMRCRIKLVQYIYIILTFFCLGHGDGELLNPCGVTYLDGKFRSTGTIVVSDWGNNRISAFDPITGQFQGHVIGETNELIETPYDISTDENGGIYLTESETNYIKLFQPVYE